MRENVGKDRGIVDAAALAEFRAKDVQAELFAPSLVQTDQGNTGSEHTVLRKRRGPPKRQPVIGAGAFEVAPHVLALRREQIERRGGPALRLEDRSKQE